LFGAPQDIVETIESHDDGFELWEENVATVGLFLQLQSQWVTSMGGVVGLNYQSVDFLFKIYGITDQKQMFEDLQAMEFAALPILNKKD
jgi:hypothetical protein